MLASVQPSRVVAAALKSSQLSIVRLTKKGTHLKIEDTCTKHSLWEKSSVTRLIIAQVSYITIIPLAIVEAALALIANALFYYSPMKPHHHTKMTNWAVVSVLSIPYHIKNVLFKNFFSYKIEKYRFVI